MEAGMRALQELVETAQSVAELEQENARLSARVEELETAFVEIACKVLTPKPTDRSRE